MQIDDRVYLVRCFEVYKPLLTQNKQDMFTDYYIEDLSINEIAENLKITKNAVYNSIMSTTKKIKEYEQCLQVISKYDANINLLLDNNIDGEIIDKLK